MNRILTFFTLIVLLAAINGCGNSAALLQPGSESSRQLGAALSQPDSNAPTAAELDAWRELQLHPGTPGVDYDPTQITVQYLSDAVLPPAAAVAAQALPLASRAAAQSNAILRKNQQYEAVTDAIAASYGLSIKQQVYLGHVNLASFALPEGSDGFALLARLRADYASAVESAGFSRLYHAFYAVNDPDYNNSSSSGGPMWGHRRIGCSSAWDMETGDPAVRVAVVDTGVRISHQELSETVLNPATEFPGQNLDVINNDNSVNDSVGHGTFIAGLIAAKGNNSRTIIGEAFGCRIIPIKIANSGSTSDANIAAGCLLGFQLGAKVINLSWGGTTSDPGLQDMVNYINDNGALFVGAAGNDGNSMVNYPAGYSAALCVASTDASDNRSVFSNYGNWVDIAAPGEFQKSTLPDKDNSYNDYTTGEWSGTSFAAPMVAAAAALLWSYNSSLTNTEVRNCLISTAASTTGFTTSIPRLDIAAALQATGGVHLTLPRPASLIAQGVVTLAPTADGNPDYIELALDGSPVGSDSSAPYSFSVDTGSILFEKADLTYTAHKAAQTVIASGSLLVDNTAGVFPLTESFEPGDPSCLGVDLKTYSQSFIQSLKKYTGPGANWTMDDLANNGPAEWTIVSGGSDGSYCSYLGDAESSYGAYETDALVTKRINLTGIASPTLVFSQRYNIQDGGQDYDRGYIAVIDDATQAVSFPKLKSGADAVFSGYQAAWTKAEVNLTPYANKKIHLAFVFESNAAQAGEQTSLPAGWWIDAITVSSGYADTLPSVGNVNIAAGSIWGAVPGLPVMDLEVSNLSRVAKVRYILDLDPVGTIGAPPDLVSTIEADPFAGSFDLSGIHNQQAMLRVLCFDGSGNAGPELSVPVVIFNLLGDTNADGSVNQADLDYLRSKTGQAYTSSTFPLFCDTDQDGVIDEADAAAVGYHWGE